MPRPSANTRDRILDVAERLVQTRGYNGFSYADVAESLRITRASLHYHFPSKGELGERLIERYTRSFLAALADIDRASTDARDRLRRYVDIYVSVLRNDRICLCGMLAAEYSTLPRGMKTELKRFFDENERWLVAVLTEGQRAGQLAFGGSARDEARLLVGSLEGAMMLARSYNDIARLMSVADRLLSGLDAARH